MIKFYAQSKKKNFTDKVNISFKINNYLKAIWKKERRNSPSKQRREKKRFIIFARFSPTIKPRDCVRWGKKMNERKVRNWNWPWTWIRHKEWTRGASGFNVLESFSRVSPLRGALTLSKFRNARPYASSRITLPVGTCVNYACAIDAPPVKLPSSLPRLFSNPLPSPFHRSSLSTVPSIPFQQFFLPIRPKRSRV